LATALADAAGIPVEWVLVSIVCINNAETRRLAVAAEEANVLISYIIEVPTDATSEDFNVTSTNTSGNLSNSDDFDNQDAQDVTLSIASAIAQLSNEELEDAIRIAQADRGITQQLTVTAVEDPVIIVKTSTSTSTSSPSSSSTSESSSSTAVSSTVASSTEQHSAGSSSSPQAALSTTAQIPGSSSTGSEIATTTDADAASSASSRSSASSASSISSSMSTVTTSSTQQPVLATLYFVVRITVANVDAFTSDAAAVQALRRAVADFLGLPVGFVRVELNVLRRLAQSLSEASSRLRHLTTSSSEVDLNFAVAIPQENDLGKTATEAANDAAATVSGTTAAELTTLIADEFVEAGVESYSLAVQEISETNVVLYGSTHTSTSTASSSSTSITDAPDQPSGSPAPEETGANAGVVALIVILVVFAVFAPCAFLIWYGKRQAAHRGEDASVKEMLNRAVAEAMRLRQEKSKAWNKLGSAAREAPLAGGDALSPHNTGIMPEASPSSWTEHEV